MTGTHVTHFDSPVLLNSDPVRARVAYQQPLTNYERMQAERVLLEPEIPKKRLGRPHPGDIAYWLAWLGGGCVLLFWVIR